MLSNFEINLGVKLKSIRNVKGYDLDCASINIHSLKIYLSIHKK